MSTVIGSDSKASFRIQAFLVDDVVPGATRTALQQNRKPHEPGRSLVAVNDSTFAQVVGRQFYGDPISVHHLDPIASESTCQSCKDGLASIELKRKHPRPKLFDNFGSYFDSCFFFVLAGPG